MDASLDTNVIIHLYNANLQSILFERFNCIRVYQFIRTKELETHANAEVLRLFDEDVNCGKIELINDLYLREKGIYLIFDDHVKDYKNLFNPSDLGEVYAIALAKTFGSICLVTDDIKEYGPHYMLMRIPDCDIRPFAFYELLFLDFIQGKINERQLAENFNIVCMESDYKCNLESKLKIFIRRFWTSPHTDNEKFWMSGFCVENKINAKDKLAGLSKYLKENPSLESN
jgi:hypothetical protein